MLDSSEEASYESDQASEGIRRKSRFPRYDSEPQTLVFCVGMTLTRRKEVKDALIKYGLEKGHHVGGNEADGTSNRWKKENHSVLICGWEAGFYFVGFDNCEYL